MDSSNSYVLEIDPDPQLIPAARLFAGSLARQFGYGEESILDVKIAVSEACTEAVTSDREHKDSIRVAVEDLGSEVLYEVRDAPEQAFDDAGDVSQEDRGVGHTMILALFPNAEIHNSPSGSLVRFALRPQA